MEGGLNSLGFENRDETCSMLLSMLHSYTMFFITKSTLFFLKTVSSNQESHRV